MSAPDRPLLGIALMTGFCVLAPVGDALAKVAGASVPLPVLLVFRFAIQAALLWPLVLLLGLPIPSGRRMTTLILIRTLLHASAIGMMFAALRYLPLADAVAIAFVMPFLILVLGWAVLGEEVGPHRIGACVVGFAGTLLVIQPNFAAVGAPALLPLGVAVLFSLFMLVTRHIAREVDAVALQAVSGVQAVVVVLPVVWFWPGAAAAVPALAPGSLALLAGIGVVGTAAHLVMTSSLRHAPAATLAPMQYLEIPFATAVGWMVFRDLPDGLAALGIGITIAAGLYVIARERAAARTPPLAAAP